jgi:hypothetical protein
MQITSRTTWIAFAQNKRIASGKPKEVVTAVKLFSDIHPATNILVFDAVTSAVIELDLRGAMATVLRRLPEALPDAPSPVVGASVANTVAAGRPRLGVVPREVTLMPRHWEWLSGQPGGASVALRKLVEHALRSSKAADRKRKAQEAAYRFMLDMAGDNPGFEEASRALFAQDMERLRQTIAKWPRDVRHHVLALAEACNDAGDKSED